MRENPRPDEPLCPFDYQAALGCLERIENFGEAHALPRPKPIERSYECSWLEISRQPEWEKPS